VYVFSLYRAHKDSNDLMPDPNLTPAVSSLMVQLSWIGSLFNMILGWLVFISNKLISFLFYTIRIIALLMGGGSLTSVSILIIKDCLGVIYQFVSFIVDYSQHLLLHKGVDPYADYSLPTLYWDYLFMMVCAVSTLILFIKSVNQPRNCINHIALLLSCLPLFSSACLVLGGLPYLTLDSGSHLDNLCSVSHIISKLLSSLYKRLKSFIESKGGLAYADLPFTRLDPYFEPLFTLFFSICTVVYLITLFYCLLEVHHLTNVYSGYVYRDIDISGSFSWSFGVFRFWEFAVFIKIIILLIHNVYYSYKLYCLISFFFKKL
jgi:hypothetical protein